MNILLILGLVLFICFIIWVYVLFVTTSLADDETPKVQAEEYDFTDAVEKCKELFAQDRHSELQVYAQKALSRNYGDVDIRKVLADSLMASGDEQMAIMHYEAILNINPYDLEILSLLANYYIENGPKTRAIELYEQIFMFDSGNVQAVEQLAILYKDVENYQKAIEMYEMMESVEVDHEKLNEISYILADLYIITENTVKAYEEYEKINENNSDNLEILLTLADLAFKNEYWKDCLNYYEKVISIVGDDLEVYEKIAQIQTTLQKYSDAAETYKKIISLENEESQNYLYHQNELCNTLLRNGNVKEAVESLKKLIARYPKETSFVFTLAHAYQAVGQYEDAVNLYEQLIEELPPEQAEMIIGFISSAISSWAQQLFNNGEYNKAFDKFFEALKYNEENDEVYYKLGVCNYYIKSYQDAVSYFKKAISIKSDVADYYFGLGCAYDEAGSTKSAKVSFFDATTIDPTFAKARIAYAIALTKELEYAKSIEQFKEVLKILPNNADTIYNLALAYELVGDSEKAIEYYKKALEADYKHKEAKNNLELLLGESYEVQNILPSMPDESQDVEVIEEVVEEPVKEIVEEAPKTPAKTEITQEFIDEYGDIFGEELGISNNKNNGNGSMFG